QWFCQSASPAEAEEVLKGIKTRLDILGVPLPEMVVVDNCCQVRARILRALPDVQVVLDVYHFMMRYLIVIIGGTKNPFRSEVAQDITDAILKTRAKKGVSATYWNRAEQERRLIEAYEKWSRKGGVWSAAAVRTHQDQLAHVSKGCLTRTRDDIRSDGSRIEGSHKGWHSLQRSFASGLVLVLALSHDFVLRRNCRISVDHSPSLFQLSTHGSHHIRLISRIATLSNALLAKENSPAKPLPELRIVDSGETFGLVSSAYATSFKGLLSIKEEPKDESEDVLSNTPEYDTEDVNNLLRNLQIDPALLLLPEPTSLTTAIHSSPALSITAQTGARLAPSSQAVLDTRAPSIVDVFALPVHESLQKLTKSQRLFTVNTGIDVRSLKISSDTEFFLFMRMRKEHQWSSFKMTPTKWATKTKLYNMRLLECTSGSGDSPVLKHPRVLQEKLVTVEYDVVQRIIKNDFKCTPKSSYSSRRSYLPSVFQLAQIPTPRRSGEMHAQLYRYSRPRVKTRNHRRQGKQR
ncbi:hypothetical protein FIBSPDRAFT_756586, partial [Athelia psychrophila]